MENKISSLEQRVLGALVEKEMTTPDYYPLTLNSLTLACNQKSNRRPVTSFSETDVMEGFDRLRRLGLAMPAASESGRVPKFRHCLVEELHLEPEHLAILCELLLRGGQTTGELRTRAERMHPFKDLAAVESALDDLQRREPPLVKCLERQPGQKERRYVHLLGEDADGAQPEPTADPPKPSRDERLEALEQEVAGLREELLTLKSQLKDLLD
jgi:uncharacterized protein YceH (UPF0502 family)